MFVSHWLARTQSSGKYIVNSVTACTVLFQPSMLPVISKQQLDFVFQKYMQINFKYLREIKITFLQNLYLQSYLNIWNYLVYWGRFRPTVQLSSTGVCSVWEHLRDALHELFAEPHCFRDCTSTKRLCLVIFYRSTEQRFLNFFSPGLESCTVTGKSPGALELEVQGDKMPVWK